MTTSDPHLDFLSPLTAVPGLGPRRVTALGESGVENVGDLLRWFPRRYVDRSMVVPIGDLPRHLDSACSVIGVITRTRVEPGRRSRFRIQVDDGTGAMEALWFAGIPYFRASLRTGMRLLLTGKVRQAGRCQMVHPQIETLAEGAMAPDITYLPQYRVTSAMGEAGVGQKVLFKAISWLLKNVRHYPQVLPGPIEKKKGFPPLAECIAQIHMPDDPAALGPFRDRVRYEDVYTTALTIRWSSRSFSQPGRAMRAGDLADRFRSVLPFQLTPEQEKALSLLLADAGRPRRMHRLLQGDVGCGKTVVAFMTCLAALHEGYQVAWMAPTEVLAYQTFLQVSNWLKPLGFRTGLLTGGMEDRERRASRRELAAGSVHCAVGTHALLQPQVRFSRLGMTVIDEQHKFGVDQRVKLHEKDPAADFLLMSATPIPQTLARTLYGDLDICTIEGLPRGRHPVSTHLVPDNKRAGMEAFVLAEVTTKGAQAYYVVPRIDDEDGEGPDEIADAMSVFDRLTGSAFKGVPAALMHGRLPSGEKERIVRDFASGAVRLLVSTTVIEVVIDSPDATVMVIENSERFGLSQLHQLRGRVGRGTKKSWCFLLSRPTGDGRAESRLREFCGLHDGFKIAEMDLRDRGPGQIAGARQSGWDDSAMSGILDNLELFREVQQELDSLFAR